MSNAGNEIAETDGTSTVHRFTSEEVLFSMLVDSTARRASGIVEDNFDRLRKRQAIGVGLVGTLFVAGLAGLVAMYSDLAIDRAAEIAADKASGAVSGELEDALTTLRTEQATLRATLERDLTQRIATQAKVEAEQRFAEAQSTIDEMIGAQSALRFVSDLEAELTRLENAPGFTPAERDELLGQVLALGDLSGIDPGRLTRLVERAIDILAAADQLGAIREIEDRFGDLMRNTIGIGVTMVQALGNNLINRPVAFENPDDPETEAWLEDFFNYRAYARLLSENNFPEVPVVFDIVLECKRDADGGPTDQSIEHTESIEQLTEQERSSVSALVRRLLSNFSGGGAPLRFVRPCLEAHVPFDRTGTLKDGFAE